MDNPSSESNALSLAQAAALYADPPEEEKKEEHQETAKAEPEEPQVEPEQPEEQEVADSGSEEITIEVDGKIITTTKKELAERYKDGMRQSDYTRKTMEVSEAKKAAEAEMSRARQERDEYAKGLAQARSVIEAQLAEQQQVNWQELLEKDAHEYLRQQHLYQQRQAQRQQVLDEQSRVEAMADAERKHFAQEYINDQQSRLIERIPEWKDANAKKAGVQSLRSYMLQEGATTEDVDKLSHHLAVVWAHKAQKYDALMSKADAATKKVAAAPQKVMKPGVSGTSNDQKAAAWQKFNKSGSIRDAASLLTQIRK